MIKMPEGNRYYTVGTYNNYISSKKDFLLGLFLTDLDITDFDTLSNEGWLSNFVIDICLAMNAFKLNLKNVQVMACCTVTSLMEYSREKRRKEIVIKENSTLFMPWLVNGNH